VLNVSGISKSFGAVAALTNVSMHLSPGEIRALCGENGAGKSTLVKILTGVYRPDAGTLAIEGKPVVIEGPRHAQELGIAVVSQELSLCPNLSVLDNIWLGTIKVPFLHRRARLRREALRMLAKLGADHIDIDAPVADLSMGERQIVEIARMLTRDARILILDEPSATLSDVEIERIFTALIALKKEGRSIIYITHRLAEVFEICDSVTVMRNGQSIDTCPVNRIDRTALIEMMLGRSFSEMYPEFAHSAGDKVLEVRDLTIPGRVEQFSMTAHKGEIVCIAGQVGSGAVDIVNALAGLVHNAGGRVVVNQRAMALGSTVRALKHEILLISGDRAEEGIFRKLTVHDNLVATRLNAYSKWGVLARRELRAAAQALAKKVSVDPRRLPSRADTLSGGNQQKLAIGRCLDRGTAGILMMNEPTRGIDVGARADIYSIMRDLCARGYTIVMTSNDLEEVVGLADTVITVYRGRQVSRYGRHNLLMHQILADIAHPPETSAKVPA
jgi:ribose transport system ATP-binding protein/rhamnose transport system ATP-binding protein